MVIPCSKVSSRSQTVLQTQAKPSQAVPTLDSAPTRRQTTVLVSVSLSETSPAGHGVDADDSAGRGSLHRRRLRPSDHDSAESLHSDRLLVPQVMEWTQTILQAEEAFASGACAQLITIQQRIYAQTDCLYCRSWSGRRLFCRQGRHSPAAPAPTCARACRRPAAAFFRRTTPQTSAWRCRCWMRSCGRRCQSPPRSEHASPRELEICSFDTVPLTAASLSAQPWTPLPAPNPL